MNRKKVPYFLVNNIRKINILRKQHSKFSEILSCNYKNHTFKHHTNYKYRLYL